MERRSTVFDGEAPRPVDFTETEHYQITRAFLAIRSACCAN
jgi:predicted ATPase